MNWYYAMQTVVYITTETIMLCSRTWPRAYKKFMLNSAEHEIFLLINVKMPTVVVICKFICRKNSILGLSEPK